MEDNPTTGRACVPGPELGTSYSVPRGQPWPGPAQPRASLASLDSDPTRRLQMRLWSCRESNLSILNPNSSCCRPREGLGLSKVTELGESLGHRSPTLRGLLLSPMPRFLPASVPGQAALQVLHTRPARMEHTTLPEERTPPQLPPRALNRGAEHPLPRLLKPGPGTSFLILPLPESLVGHL